MRLWRTASADDRAAEQAPRHDGEETWLRSVLPVDDPIVTLTEADPMWERCEGGRQRLARRRAVGLGAAAESEQAAA